MKIKDKARLYRELGHLLGSGFHMDRSVNLLLGQDPSAGRRGILEALQRGLAEGTSFGGALRAYGGVSSLELSLLESGEKSGRLAESCKHLSHYFEVWDRGVRAARGAMAYPLVLLHLGVVVPEFAKHMLKQAFDSSAQSTLGDAIVWRLIFFWGFLALLWLVWRTLTAAAARSRALDELLGLLPFIGAVRRHWALARFSQVFHSGLLAAMRMTQCLAMAGDAAQSGTLREGVRRAMPEVEAGGELAPSLRATGCFPRAFTDAVATAEASGGMDNEMARWAEAETHMAGEAQSRAAEWYPKALYFGVLGYVGYSIVGFVRFYLERITELSQ